MYKKTITSSTFPNENTIPKEIHTGTNTTRQVVLHF